jgi:hypothetical protein
MIDKDIVRDLISIIVPVLTILLGFWRAKVGAQKLVRDSRDQLRTSTAEVKDKLDTMHEDVNGNMGAIIAENTRLTRENERLRELAPK